METIYKQQIGDAVGVNIDVRIHADAKIVAVQEQDDQICLWYRCSPAAFLERRLFMIVGTGYPVEKEWAYHGTVQVGALVWHVMEVT